MNASALKVVIVNDASIARGGATGLALFQAKLLRERGIEVVFFAADGGCNKELSALGVKTYAVGSDPLMKSHPIKAATRGLYSKPVKALLEKVIEIEDSPRTVYHVHSWSKTLTTSVFAALNQVAPRVFIHAHDFFLACPNGAFMDYQAEKPCNRLPLSVDCLRTHCDKRSYPQKLWRVGRQAVLRHTLPRRSPWGGILLIHPKMAPFFSASGYDANKCFSVRNPATALCETRVEVEKNDRFLFIGRVEAEKGIEDLIAAAAQVNLPLSVIGDGPLREELTIRYPDVNFLGWLQRPQIAAQAAMARAIVMPSRYPEPFGLVAAEASLSGLPIIVSKTALLASEISEYGIGYNCNTRDVSELAAVMKQVADLPAAEIAYVSKQAYSGNARLCNTPMAWIDAQLALYEKALAT